MTREEAIKCIQEEKLRYERAPWVNSCPMMEEWQKAIDICDMALSALRAQQEQESKPLTQDEISKMAGKPVYCLELECYGIIEIETVGHYANKPFLVGAWHSELGVATIFEHDIKKKHYTLYRHKPKLEGQK